MTCEKCGSPAQGDLCRDCRFEDAREDTVSSVYENYKCPDCGRKLSTLPDRPCWLCRDGGNP